MVLNKNVNFNGNVTFDDNFHSGQGLLILIENYNYNIRDALITIKSDKISCWIW